MTTQSGQTVLINGFGVLFVILNSFGLGLRLPIGKLLAEAFAHWKIAVWALAINLRHHPAPVHRLSADDSLVHSWTRSRSGSVSQPCVQACRSLLSSPVWPRRMSASPPRCWWS